MSSLWESQEGCLTLDETKAIQYSDEAKVPINPNPNKDNNQDFFFPSEKDYPKRYHLLSLMVIQSLLSLMAMTIPIIDGYLYQTVNLTEKAINMINNPLMSS